MTLTMETISVVCLTEDQEDGDLILDLMVDGINMVSYSVALLFRLFSNIHYEEQSNYGNYYCTDCSTCFHKYFASYRKTVENEMLKMLKKHIVCTPCKSILRGQS